jgi:hypothetical protein
VFIGIFVVLGATAEEAALLAAELLDGVRIRDLPLWPLSAVDDAELTAARVAADTPVLETGLMTGAPLVLVTDDDNVIGAVCASDLDRLLRARARQRTLEHKLVT